MIAETIQSSVAPVFLLVATGALLNVITGRLARVVDRSRDLIDRLAAPDCPDHDRLVAELRAVDRRMDVINNSIFSAVLSGIVVCLLVALLFVQEVARLALGLWPAAAFVLAMLLLLVSLIWFLIEVRLAIRTIHVPAELLELDDIAATGWRRRGGK